MNLKFWNSKLPGWTYRHIRHWVNRHDLEVERQYRYDDCIAKFRERLEKNNIPADKPAPGEDEYIRFWQQFDRRVEPYTYRFFSHIVGPNPHIVPEDVADAYIESVLNPKQYRNLYNDKNFFAKIIPDKDVWPQTILCRIDGGAIMNAQFEGVTNGDVATVLKSYDKAVLKPSKDSHSGQGVRLLQREGDKLKDKDGRRVDACYLLSYGDNFVIQEVVQQHPYLEQFCHTSCNTMRVMTYRSVKDESISIFGAVLRIGHEGSFVDNLFAGGGFVTIDVETGILGKCVYDEFGRNYNEINGVDFSSVQYQIPFWQEVCDFAESVGQQIPHCRLIAMDITYDFQNKPRLIEFNIGSLNWSLSMYAGKTNFGDKFDEVIDYCLKHKKDIDK